MLMFGWGAGGTPGGGRLDDLGRRTRFEVYTAPPARVILAHMRTILPFLLCTVLAVLASGCESETCHGCDEHPDTGPSCVSPGGAGDQVMCNATTPCCSPYVCNATLGYCTGCPGEGMPCVEGDTGDAGP
jgi:hypothetical protein